MEIYWISKKFGKNELLLSYEFNIKPLSELKISFSCYVLKENNVTRKKKFGYLLAFCSSLYKNILFLIFFGVE